MVGGKIKTRETEVARREEVVRLGRFQVQMMEMRRHLEQTERRIQERLRRSQEVERLLGEVEREKEVEQEDTEAEILRRAAVVEVWRLQVKVMERRRRLERMLEEIRQQFIREDERQKMVEDIEMKMVRAGDQLETRGETPGQMSIYQYIYPGLAEKLAQQLQPLHAQLEEVTVMMETMMTSLEEVETLQHQDQQKAEALR